MKHSLAKRNPLIARPSKYTRFKLFRAEDPMIEDDELRLKDTNFAVQIEAMSGEFTVIEQHENGEVTFHETYTNNQQAKVRCIQLANA